VAFVIGEHRGGAFVFLEKNNQIWFGKIIVSTGLVESLGLVTVQGNDLVVRDLHIRLKLFEDRVELWSTEGSSRVASILPIPRMLSSGVGRAAVSDLSSEKIEMFNSILGFHCACYSVHGTELVHVSIHCHENQSWVNIRTHRGIKIYIHILMSSGPTDAPADYKNALQPSHCNVISNSDITIACTLDPFSISHRSCLGTVRN